MGASVCEEYSCTTTFIINVTDRFIQVSAAVNAEPRSVSCLIVLAAAFTITTI